MRCLVKLADERYVDIHNIYLETDAGVVVRSCISIPLLMNICFK